jgi:ribonuclease P protein component
MQTQEQAQKQVLVMLKKTDEFSSVFSFRKRFSSSFFVVHYTPNQQQSVRIGFIVAKRVAKLAVDRNYMRRVMREYCRHALPSQLAADVVIQVHKKFENKHFSAIQEELKLAFEKIQKKLSTIER